MQKKIAVVGLFAALTAATTGIFATGAASAAAVSANASADKIVAAATCTGPNAISTGTMKVDGVPVTFGDAKVFINGGSTVSVTFTVASGCNNIAFGLAAYANPVHTADPTYQDVAKQTYLTSSSTTKSSGESATLTVSLPEISDCQYQVDFFSGPVLTKLGNGNFYGSPEARLISVTHVAVPECASVLPEESTTSTVRPTTTTSTAPGVIANETTIRPTTSTSAQVEAQSVSASTTVSDPPAQVLDTSLARTGAETLPLMGAGLAFAIAGGALTVFAGALRRRRDTLSGRHYR